MLPGDSLMYRCSDTTEVTPGYKTLNSDVNYFIFTEIPNERYKVRSDLGSPGKNKIIAEAV